MHRRSLLGCHMLFSSHRSRRNEKRKKVKMSYVHPHLRTSGAPHTLISFLQNSSSQTLESNPTNFSSHDSTPSNLFNNSFSNAPRRTTSLPSSRALPIPDPVFRLKPKQGLPLLPQTYYILSSRRHGLYHIQNTHCIVSLAANMAAGQSDRPGKLNLNRSLELVRKLHENLPQPVKSFPWDKALGNFSQITLELVYAVVKYLFVPVLAVSSLSEMSYCAQERKMIFIPIPLLAGIAVAGVLKDTALELSPGLKEEEFPWHLLAIAVFFILLKLLGPYYPYWGRILLPHFANGGLWRILWSAFLWYRRPQESQKSALGTSQAGEKKL